MLVLIASIIILIEPNIWNLIGIDVDKIDVGTVILFTNIIGGILILILVTIIVFSFREKFFHLISAIRIAIKIHAKPRNDSDIICISGKLVDDEFTHKMMTKPAKAKSATKAHLTFSKNDISTSDENNKRQ